MSECPLRESRPRSTQFHRRTVHGNERGELGCLVVWVQACSLVLGWIDDRETRAVKGERQNTLVFTTWGRRWGLGFEMQRVLTRWEHETHAHILANPRDVAAPNFDVFERNTQVAIDHAFSDGTEFS